MPYIYSINQLGRVIVRFNDTMIVPLTSDEQQANHINKEGKPSPYHNRKLQNSFKSDSFDPERMVIGDQYVLHKNYSLVNNGTIWFKDQEHRALETFVVDNNENTVTE